MLVIHGDVDQVLPLDKTVSRLPGLIKDMHHRRGRRWPARYPRTHADQVNATLLDFLRA